MPKKRHATTQKIPKAANNFSLIFRSFLTVIENNFWNLYRQPHQHLIAAKITPIIDDKLRIITGSADKNIPYFKKVRWKFKRSALQKGVTVFEQKRRRSALFGRFISKQKRQLQRTVAKKSKQYRLVAVVVRGIEKSVLILSRALRELVREIGELSKPQIEPTLFNQLLSKTAPHEKALKPTKSTGDGRFLRLNKKSLAVGGVLALLISIGLGSYATYLFAFADLPPVSDLVEKKQPVTTRILDRNGELLFRIYEDENRTLINLSELPPHVIDATIAIEDKYFFAHRGFSASGIMRAMIANAQTDSIQGGSTITQQLVKNRLLTSERTFRRKIREMILAIQVERAFSKEEILEMYLNQVPFGGATYGIEEAAQTYFGKSARELTLSEATMLAGLPAAPSVYSPFGSRPELAFVRQEEVIRRMVEDGLISAEEAEEARSRPVLFRPNLISIKAPHFVMYVRELLSREYGDEALYQEGFEVRTTLDLAFQEEVQSIVSDEVASLERMRVSNGAALVTAPRTGEVLAMVGSVNYFDFDNDGQVNVTLQPRQPGSAIKPLTYATAFARGKTPLSIVDDSPITYNLPGSRPYSPRNYDGSYRGPVTLKQALASSYNIPAVKVLAEIGIEPVIDQAERMGITTWQDRGRFGLSLTLGGGEVLMTDMAKLYGTFANYGQTVDLNPILEIKNSAGDTIYRNHCVLDGYNCPQRRTLDPRIAYQITQILSDNQARTPAFGPQSVLYIPGQEVAVKTGTTNSLRDNWTFGYTSDYVVSVWVGNNDNSPMSYVASGITGASPIWNKVTRLLLDPLSPHQFVRPEGMVAREICLQTGTLACAGCPTIIEELFIPGTEPSRACDPSFFWPREENWPETFSGRDQLLEARSF